MQRRIWSICLMMTWLISSFCMNHQLVEAQGNEASDTKEVSQVSEHGIPAGPSFEGNPLKGFIPYDELTTDTLTDFPHSMEWFYLPVNAVQSSLTDYDWTALEERLDAIASRGNQAVFRFYYDYPDLPTGVPQFVIDAGLVLNPYDEPDNLGGGGLCPDYSNTFFLESMKAFIQAFGEKYDGDPRIGAITLGLLGFWGEWHTWPYDEDTSDGKPNWNIPTSVFGEVLKAYDDAFDTTQLCMREPKWDVDQTSADVGFHDDSFAFATLTEAAGGQSWSFMSKVTSLEMQDRWQTNCIGGEVYPPTQSILFKNADMVSESGQKFKHCVDQTHVTWLINEGIKSYQGDELTAARKASMMMGYDFQVQSSIYKDTVTDGQQTLTINIKNIGVAPFYYDHRTWPIAIGVFKEDVLVDTVMTDWDLNTIPADGKPVVFEQQLISLDEAGNYVCKLQVINPMANGKPLLFANLEQQLDGWLPVAQFAVEAAPQSSGQTDAEQPENGQPDASPVWLWAILGIGAGIILGLVGYWRIKSKTKQ